MPRISIIVTIYNPQIEYFKECLESIKNQSFSDIEVLLIDDGSEQKVAQICDDYSNRDDRFITYHRENSGVSISSNFGISVAKGDYITFVDHDDIISKDMCEIIIEEVKDAEVLIWNYISFSKNFEKKADYVGKDYVLYNKGDINNLLIQILDPTFSKFQQISLLGANWGKLYNREFLLNRVSEYFPEHMMGGEDAIFTYRAFKKAEKVIFINKYLYYYRQNEFSYTKRFKANMLHDEISMLNVLEKEVSDNERDMKAYYRRCCSSYIAVCGEMILHKDNKNSLCNKILELKQISDLPEYKVAISNYKHLDLNRAKNIFFFLVKRRMYALALMTVKLNKIRNREQMDA